MRISDWSSDVCSSDLRPDRLGGLGDDDDLHSGAGARPRLCVEEGSTRLGVELARPAHGTLLPAGTQPDQHFFDALHSEVSPKVFLGTSTSDIVTCETTRPLCVRTHRPRYCAGTRNPRQPP